MNYKIIHLPEKDWKDTILNINYTSDEYYDVIINKNTLGFNIDITKKNFDSPITHNGKEYNFPDRLYNNSNENLYAWGIINDGKLIAAIQTSSENSSNRLRIDELWIDMNYRKQGIGKKLINIAKEQLRHENRRTLILETQSCNVPAIDFYFHEGFNLIGFDTCYYKNNDIKRKEVRFELGWIPNKKNINISKDLKIRPEIPSDYFDTEYITKKAFWNKHQLGCDEHYLVHKLRNDESFIPELSHVAEVNGKIVGCIMYSKSYIINNNEKTEILTFGPLSVDPDYQGIGIGKTLIEETFKLAKKLNYRAVIIFGEPKYYPKVGFKTCDNFSITTIDGKNFDAFLGYELFPNSLKNITGKFIASNVFNNLSDNEAEKFDKKFPYMDKYKFPSQWI
jgi:predicted N-acetyltransferase YhbS